VLVQHLHIIRNSILPALDLTVALPLLRVHQTRAFPLQPEHTLLELLLLLIAGHLTLQPGVRCLLPLQLLLMAENVPLQIVRLAAVLLQILMLLEEFIAANGLFSALQERVGVEPGELGDFLLRQELTQVVHLDVK